MFPEPATENWCFNYAQQVQKHITNTSNEILILLKNDDIQLFNHQR